jgi:hypothetical protein
MSSGVLFVFGVVIIINGKSMLTSVDGSVVDFGRLFERQTNIMSGFAIIGLAFLTEILAEVRGLRPIYPKRR